MKIKSLKGIVLAAIGLTGMSLGANAQASCYWYGLVKSYSTTKTTATFYVSENSSVPTRYMVFTTTDHDWMRVMTTAQAARATVRVIGNAGSCGSGTFGNGGSITGVDVSHGL